jgi:hypothetical protein
MYEFRKESRTKIRNLLANEIWPLELFPIVLPGMIFNFVPEHNLNQNLFLQNTGQCTANPLYPSYTNGAPSDPSLASHARHAKPAIKHYLPDN